MIRTNLTPPNFLLAKLLSDLPRSIAGVGKQAESAAAGAQACREAAANPAVEALANARTKGGNTHMAKKTAKTKGGAKKKGGKKR